MALCTPANRGSRRSHAEPRPFSDVEFITAKLDSECRSAFDEIYKTARVQNIAQLTARDLGFTHRVAKTELLVIVPKRLNHAPKTHETV